MPQQPNRDEIRARISQYISEGDYTGWFEKLYAGANQNTDWVPWSHVTTHPFLVGWLENNELQGEGQRAIVPGCGLGDDAEKLSQLGFDVTAFDISSSAIEWCKQRFPDTTVDYQIADLFDLPTDWLGQFDFMLDIFTVQALPQSLRQDTLKMFPPLLKQGGTFLLITGGREHHITPQGPPWAVSREELKTLENEGLTIEHAEDLKANEISRHFRILYRK